MNCRTDETNEGWRAVENLLAEFSALAKSDTSVHDFFHQLLARTVEALGAVGGAVWLSESGTDIRLECQVGLLAQPNSAGRLSEDFHQRIAASVFRSSEHRIVEPGSNGFADEDANPTENLFVAVPMTFDDKPTGVMELVLRPTDRAAVQRGSLRLIRMLCDLAAEFLLRRELGWLRRSQTASQGLDEFVQRSHASLDPKAASYEIVNAGRRFIDCDRVAVVLGNSGRFQTMAVSGVETIERRTNTLRLLESLGAVVAQTGEALWYDRQTTELDARLREPIRSYAGQTGACSVAVVPLRASGSDARTDGNGIIGCIVAERFDGDFDDAARRRIEDTSRHAALALGNALQYARSPWLNRLNWLAGAGRTRSRRLLKLGILCAAVLVAACVLFFVPAEFNVRAEGELQPQVRRDVFAPSDGQIGDVLVAHDDQVNKGDVVLVMESRQLDLEFQRIQGEYETTRKRLLGVEASRLQLEQGDEASGSQSSQLSAEEDELKQLLLSQNRQLALLREAREKLAVQAPISGSVLTWDLERLLEDRPVQRGQTLLTVADMDGPWVAELWVPHDKVGYLLQRQRDRDGALPVSVSLTTSLGKTWRGQAEQLPMRAELSDDGRPGVRITVLLDRRQMPELRPGAAVFAKIHCGRKPLGYVWLSDVIESVRGWLLF